MRRLTALRALHPFPSFLVAILTMAIVPLADRHAPVSRYVTLGLGMLLFQFAIGLTNDVVDVNEDRAAKPWKPLARGSMSRRVAGALAAGLAAAGLALTSRLPAAAWAIGGAGLLCGLSYDLYLKRTDLSWLPYSLAFPLVPIWVYAASDSWTLLLWWTLPLGAVLGFALQLANQAPDAAAGEASGLPGRLGERRSRVMAVAVFAAVSGAVAIVLGSEHPARSLAAATIGLAIIIASAFATRLFGRDGLFGLLALGSAVLAVLFLSAA